MKAILEGSFSDIPWTSFQELVAPLPKSRQRAATVLLELLKHKPLSALQQFSTLQTAFTSSTISKEGEMELDICLRVLCYYTEAASVSPIFTGTARLETLRFWEACIATELPRMLMEIVAFPEAFKIGYLFYDNKALVVCHKSRMHRAHAHTIYLSSLRSRRIRTLYGALDS